jgi:hypothetical protein
VPEKVSWRCRVGTYIEGRPSEGLATMPRDFFANIECLSDDGEKGRISVVGNWRSCTVNKFKATPQSVGLGRAAMPHIEGLFSELGCRRIFLHDVLESAEEFWGKMGFGQGWDRRGVRWEKWL